VTSRIQCFARAKNIRAWGETYRRRVTKGRPYRWKRSDRENSNFPDALARAIGEYGEREAAA
jgi:hypothetical protein